MEQTPIVILHFAELEKVLGGEGALVGVEIHLDVAHAGHDEHRHLRNLSASALGCRTAGRWYFGGDEAENGIARRPMLLGFLQNNLQMEEYRRRRVVAPSGGGNRRRTRWEMAGGEAADVSGEP